jgi:chaperonin GroES
MKAINIRPLGDRILVKRVEEEVQRGGIIIPDTAKEKSQQAEVIAVGPGKLFEGSRRWPMSVKSGDWILIGRYSGTEITIEGEECLILREDDILAVIAADPLTGRPPRKDHPGAQNIEYEEAR